MCVCVCVMTVCTYTHMYMCVCVQKFSKTPEGSETGRHAFTHNGNTVYE